jgi:hydrogenase maturation factor HypF (carbamoyltransferase family)
MENKENWLVCGTRKKGYEAIVFETLNKLMIQNKNKPDTIIEGCCPDSADEYAEEWAKQNKIEIQHHPATPRNYLKRNIEMVNKCNLVICFWDGFSYGSCHTVAQATMRKLPVIIINLKEKKDEK